VNSARRPPGPASSGRFAAKVTIIEARPADDMEERVVAKVDALARRAGRPGGTEPSLLHTQGCTRPGPPPRVRGRPARAPPPVVVRNVQPRGRLHKPVAHRLQRQAILEPDRILVVSGEAVEGEEREGGKGRSCGEYGNRRTVVITGWM